MKKRLEKLEQDVKEIKRYIEISEGSSENFDEIITRVKKWEKENHQML